MRILGTFVVLLLFSATTTAKTPNRQLLLSIHRDLNAMCRGGYGNRPETDQACNVRSKVSELLRSTRAPARANGQTNADLALSIYKDLDAMCRGGYGNRPETDQACKVRNKVSTLLRNMGYCWRGAWWRKCRS